eukprot:TRINITY_DN14412_c0_g1_i1.p1 TRINITY_DN14412_c0_g1~~TRINITY_DN14412_c0_g1_i1.p1  ORF type:complete len:248 (-),score=36.93 TRINITY_DN14412_c0_g1_i1:118-861(-)
MCIRDREELKHFKQVLVEFVEDCIPKMTKRENSIAITSHVECSVQLMKIQDEIVGATVLDLLNKEQEGAKFQMYRKQQLKQTFQSLTKFHNTCIKGKHFVQFDKVNTYEACKYHTVKAAALFKAAREKKWKEAERSWTSSKEFAIAYEDLSRQCGGYLNGTFIKIPKRSIRKAVAQLIHKKIPPRSAPTPLVPTRTLPLRNTRWRGKHNIGSKAQNSRFVENTRRGTNVESNSRGKTGRTRGGSSRY